MPGLKPRPPSSTHTLETLKPGAKAPPDKLLFLRRRPVYDAPIPRESYRRTSEERRTMTKRMGRFRVAAVVAVVAAALTCTSAWAQGAKPAPFEKVTVSA